MATTAFSTTGRWDIRTTIFRIVAIVCIAAFLQFGGVASIATPWGSPGFPFPGFTPELHRWHSALLGVSEALLLPGLLLALLGRPRERPLLMQFYVVASVALVVPHLLHRGSTPLASFFIPLPVLAYPALGKLVRIPGKLRPNRWLLGTALLAAALLVPDAWHNLQAQRMGEGGEHAVHGHWSTAASLDVVVLLALVTAASGLPGSGPLGLIAGAALIYLGAAAIAIPDHAGSWGTTRGSFAILLGAATATAAVLTRPRAITPI